jgi:hypothetical protein
MLASLRTASTGKTLWAILHKENYMKIFCLLLLLLFYFSCNDTDKNKINYTENKTPNINSALSTDDYTGKISYEDTFPFINENNVSIRNYPFFDSGKVLFELQKGQIISVDCRTIENDNINGEEWPWYRISVDHDYNKSGWVYGKSISFNVKYGEKYYESQPGFKTFSRFRYYRTIFADEFITQILGKTAYGSVDFDVVLLEKYSLIESQKTTGIWYLDQAGYELKIYTTEFGEIWAFVNTENKSWRLYSILINKRLENESMMTGMTIDQLKSNFGTDLETEGKYMGIENSLEFNFKWDFGDIYIINIIPDGNLVKEIIISVFYT